jgi:hypothetical protein
VPKLRRKTAQSLLPRRHRFQRVWVLPQRFAGAREGKYVICVIIIIIIVFFGGSRRHNNPGTKQPGSCRRCTSKKGVT